MSPFLYSSSLPTADVSGNEATVADEEVLTSSSTSTPEESVSGGDVLLEPEEETEEIIKTNENTETVSGNTGSYVEQIAYSVLGEETEISAEQLAYQESVLTSLHRQEIQNEAILAVLLCFAIGGVVWICYKFLRWFF